MKGECDGRMERGGEGEIINEPALPVTPRENPDSNAALHWPAGSWDNFGAAGEGGGGGGGVGGGLSGDEGENKTIIHTMTSECGLSWDQKVLNWLFEKMKTSKLKKKKKNCSKKSFFSSHTLTLYN